MPTMEKTKARLRKMTTTDVSQRVDLVKVPVDNPEEIAKPKATGVKTECGDESVSGTILFENNPDHEPV